MDMVMDMRNLAVKHEMEIVQCSVCKAEMAGVHFAAHNLEMHNMLSWIEGADPLDMSNEKLVLSLLNKTLKSKKKKFLSCEICGEEKKSAVGFFTHKQVCGKSQEEKDQLRIPCEKCGKSVMPVSLRSHMMIHQRRAAEEIALPISSSTSPNPSTSRGDHNGKKSKRAAATRAKSKMIEFLSDEGHSPRKTSKPTQLYSDLGKPGWSSASRLLQTWRGFISLTSSISCVYTGCKFRSDNINGIRSHVENCEISKTHDMRFMCNICLIQRRDESDIAAHIHREHDSKDSNVSSDVNSLSDKDSASDGEMESPRVPVKRQSRQSRNFTPKQAGPQRAFHKMRFLHNTVPGLGKDLDIYPAAMAWTLEFRQANYVGSAFPSLCTLKEDWILLREDARNYTPSASNSIPIEFQSSLQENPLPPHKFSLFEGQIIEGVTTFFTGGPVWAMEWCPLPMRECLSEENPPSDYLAVSTHHNMDDTFCVPKIYSFPNIIQFWDCGNLSSNNVYQRPKLALALAHDNGTIWSLAWCPSGAYDCVVDSKAFINERSQLRRLGLLALGCSSGNVVLFSIPFPDQLQDHSEQRALPIYKSKPCLTLTNNFMEPSQCTRVTWYEGRGHGFVAAGYCNGMVAIWDIVTLPPLLYDNQRKTLKPFVCFQAHLTVISALSFNPEYDGRFFMTGSHDRGIKFWDMEDLSAPLTHHRRGYVTDGVWLNLWISSITSYDDAFQHEHTNSTLHPVRDYGYKPYPLLTQNSVAWCLSYNEWINATAQGSEAGEIVVTFSSQLMRGLDNEKNAIDKRIMASYTLLKKIATGDDGETSLGEVVMWKPQPKQGAKGKGKKGGKIAKGKGKSGLQEDDSRETEVAASLYSPDAVLVDRNPKVYRDVERGYGISVFDVVKSDTNKNKLPEEAKSRVRISGKMHPSCSDYYPITSVNKIAWNSNIGRFFWLASGHQCGIVRISGMHFMQNAAYRSFMEKASETVLFDE